VASTGRHVRLEAVAPDASVTPLELFFDLVFVFGLTQVTALLAEDLNGHGLIRGTPRPRPDLVELGRLRLARQRRPG
jgi:hypothetical protein